MKYMLAIVGMLLGVAGLPLHTRAATGLPQLAACGNADVCADGLVCSAGFCVPGLENPADGIISGLANPCSATDCCRQGLMCAAAVGLQVCIVREQTGTTAEVACTGTVPPALPPSPQLGGSTGEPPIGGFEDSSSTGPDNVLPDESSSSGEDESYESSSGNGNGGVVPPITSIPGLTGFPYPGLSGYQYPGLTGVGSGTPCGNKDTCTNGEVCFANICVTQAFAGNNWSGTGNKCSASDCCPKPLSCITGGSALAGSGSFCAPYLFSGTIGSTVIQRINCAATGGPNSGVTTGSQPAGAVIDANGTPTSVVGGSGAMPSAAAASMTMLAAMAATVRIVFLW